MAKLIRINKFHFQLTKLIKNNNILRLLFLIYISYTIQLIKIIKNIMRLLFLISISYTNHETSKRCQYANNRPVFQYPVQTKTARSRPFKFRFENLRHSIKSTSLMTLFRSVFDLSLDGARNQGPITILTKNWVNLTIKMGQSDLKKWVKLT